MANGEKTPADFAEAAKRKRTAKKKTTSTSEWKRTAQGMPLEVPSGNTALVRPVGMEVFMRQGIIPNSLRPMITEALKGKDLNEALKLDDITEKQVEEMIELFDAVTVFCVKEPVVSAVPRNEDGTPVPLDERDPDKLYVDEVDFDDKQFIFNFVVGGTRDVESFRKEQAELLERVRPSEDVEDTPERVAGDR